MLLFQVKARLIKMGHLNSMNIFLRQEIDRMQKVISILRNSLSDLKLAIEGTIIMSEVSCYYLYSCISLWEFFYSFILTLSSSELERCLGQYVWCSYTSALEKSVLGFIHSGLLVHWTFGKKCSIFNVDIWRKTQCFLDDWFL